MTAVPSFNLIDQPWIPCAPRGGGAPKLLGILNTLADAHELREIADDSPLVTVGLHRLLLAILHRVLRGPSSVEEWRALKERGRFDAQQIGDYLERWRSCFDLFDAERPFYQVSFMAEVNTVAAAKLAHEKASGNNITLFDHTTAENGALTPAQAARYLVAFQAFAGGGGVSTPFYLSDAPLARDYTVLARGETVFETLLLNLVRYTKDDPIAWLGSDDLPAWERDERREPQQEGTIPEGYLDYLTWQSRVVHLVVDETTGLVRQCQIRQRFRVSQNVFDPFKAYRKIEEKGWLARRLSEERAVWRDSHALLEVAKDALEANSRRPEVFEWLAHALPSGIGRRRGVRQYDFDVLGYLNDGVQATIILWRHDRLPLRLAYLSDRDLRDTLRDALNLAEDVSELFQLGFGGGGGQKRSYPRPMRVLAAALLTGISGRKADERDMRQLVKHYGAEREYWSALEPSFRSFMSRLADAVDADEKRTTLSEWVDSVERRARDAFGTVVGGLDLSARALRAAALAERAFNWQLREIVTTYRSRHL
jgi:CRISPR system Cascade subunit CasA